MQYQSNDRTLAGQEKLQRLERTDQRGLDSVTAGLKDRESFKKITKKQQLWIERILQRNSAAGFNWKQKKPLLIPKVYMCQEKSNTFTSEFSLWIHLNTILCKRLSYIYIYILFYFVHSTVSVLTRTIRHWWLAL